MRDAMTVGCKPTTLVSRCDRGCCAAASRQQGLTTLGNTTHLVATHGAREGPSRALVREK